MNVDIGLCTVSSKERAVEAVIELAAEAGYDGVELWGRDHVGDGSVDDCRRIVDAVDANGLGIPVYGSYLRCGTDEFDDRVEHELAIAGRLDADLIRVWAGRQEYEDHDAEHWNRVVCDLERLTDRAAAYGVGVTVEKHAGTLTDTLEGARRLIEAVDDEHCGLNYQPGFSVPKDEIEREATELAPRSNNLHLQAVRECGESRRCPLSEAFYDLETVLAPFLDAGFDGSANVEFVTDERPYPAAIEADRRYVASILQADSHERAHTR
ncbi:sugar phosphate isomerase/epimerase family protein [Halalkalicoccus subterraneus]|uniref:sugar phosphate isomerase/epimerase family protein n=1 Tax=Halalkalicoccus subterraneus TaxID=2675002 RepID=UPI000EFCE89C|nr:sugar phosphate isomerase/epimerase family protein [Halalkalicoccus subterraneus]